MRKSYAITQRVVKGFFRDCLIFSVKRQIKNSIHVNRDQGLSRDS